MMRSEFVRMAQSVKCWPYKLRVREEFAQMHDGVVVDVMVRTLDSETFVPTRIATTFALEGGALEMMDRPRAMHWLYETIVKLAMHELGEFFTCDGLKPYYPHGEWPPVRKEPIDVDRWTVHGK